MFNEKNRNYIFFWEIFVLFAYQLPLERRFRGRAILYTTSPGSAL